MTDNTLQYGDIIRKIRKKKKMTQQDLANKVNIGKTAISNYETGYSMPSTSILTKIAQAFGMTLIEFLSYEKEYEIGSFNMPRFNQPTNDMIVPYLRDKNVTQEIIAESSYMDTFITLPGFILDDDSGYICIKVPDDGMDNDGLCKNDYAIIKKTVDIPNKSVVLAFNRKSGKYLIRRYLLDGHIIALLPSSDSSKFPIIRSDARDEEYTLIGYVEKAVIKVR